MPRYEVDDYRPPPEEIEGISPGKGPWRRAWVRQSKNEKRGLWVWDYGVPTPRVFLETGHALNVTYFCVAVSVALGICIGLLF